MSCYGVIIGMPVKEKRRIGQIILQPACTRTLIDNPRTEGKKRKLECSRKNLTFITEGPYNSYIRRSSKITIMAGIQTRKYHERGALRTSNKIQPSKGSGMIHKTHHSLS